MKLPRESKSKKGRRRGYLDGQMLIAMPAMMDERFSRSLIYVCAHSSEGAMGIVVNHPAPNIDFSDLLVKLDVIPAKDVIRLPPQADVVKVMRGGPVETERGFVLHSADYFVENSTLPIDDSICLTATIDILKAIARGAGPASAITTLTRMIRRPMTAVSGALCPKIFMVPSYRGCRRRGLRMIASTSATVLSRINTVANNMPQASMTGISRLVTASIMYCPTPG